MRVAVLFAIIGSLIAASAGFDPAILLLFNLPALLFVALAWIVQAVNESTNEKRIRRLY
jgi:hypothetical protein